LAWIEAVEDATLIGFIERRSDTYDERARQLSMLLPHREEDTTLLARALEAADYSEEGADDAIAGLAIDASDKIREAARDLSSIKARVTRWLDPRPTLQAWRSARSAQQRRITTVSTADHEPDHELV
jgi:hypothetical protein